MSDLNFRKSFPFINTTIFTDNNIPLPINEEEEIIYYNLSAKFSLVLGNGAPAYTSRYNSYKGYLFLTNYHVIYRPLNTSKFFDSFFVTLDDILNIENESYFEIKVTDDYASNVYINCEDCHINIFYEALKKALYNYMSDKTLTQVEEDNCPLYCEACKNK